MANRDQQRFRARKPLLPATDSREFSETGDEGPSSSGATVGRLPKRAKVTAVACQPCQVRKSKCDGQRPMCSSCQQKGRNDCVYDSASDLRRTSALKQRIENLQHEVSDLKDILLALCTAYGVGTSDALLSLVHQHIGQGDFSRIPELAQVFRTNPSLATARQAQNAQQHDGMTQTETAFGRFQQTPQGFDINYQNMVQDGVEQPSATGLQHDWAVDRSQQPPDANSEQQDFQRGYMYHP